MSIERDAILRKLLRAISLSEGEFALLVARSNSVAVRDLIVAELRSQLPPTLFELQLASDMDQVNLVVLLEEAPAGTPAASVIGLEQVQEVQRAFAIANQTREDFRKRCPFPLVLWVTDDVEMQLRRQAPDLASWAAPTFVFALEQSELREILEQETAEVVDQAFALQGRHPISPNLSGAWQEWQQQGEPVPPDLAARVALAFGLGEADDQAAREAFERCLALQESAELEAAARFRLGLWWERQGKLNRAEFLTCCDRARSHLDQAWHLADQQPQVSIALGRVLVALALAEPQDSERWQAVAQLADQGVTQPELAHGLWAEAALAQADYAKAEQEATQALAASEQYGWPLLLLGSAQLGLAQPDEAVVTLEQALGQVEAEIDPDLHIRILKALHAACWGAGDYQRAFDVKCDRAAVETEFGLRAFLGAGRLRPRQRLGAIGEAATEEIAASGRQADLDALVARVRRNDCRLTVIHGPSGVGKSSLIRAGLVPTLRQMTHRARRVVPIVLEHYQDWQAELSEQLRLVCPSNQKDLGLIEHLSANDRQQLLTVLIFDQFEEFFFKQAEVAGRQPLYEFLQACLNVENVWVFLSLREDYLHFLLELDRKVDFKLINNDILNKNVRYYLGNFSQERAEQVIRELTVRSPYRMELELIQQLSADLAADLGEVRPVELQVVGAEMLHSDAKVTTLAQYQALGGQPKQRLVERWLTQVVEDCGPENQELAQRTLMALTEEPEKRPVKTLVALQREVRLRTSKLSPEEKDFAVTGDLKFVIRVLIGAGLAFEIPAASEMAIQLIHDYLVPLVRQHFGGQLARQLRKERQRRKSAETNLRKRNRWLIFAAIISIIFGLSALMLASQRGRGLLAARAVADSLTWKGWIDTGLDFEEQVTVLEQTQWWQSRLTNLREDHRLELIITLHHSLRTPKIKNTLEGHTEAIRSVAFSSDGKMFLTGSEDKTAKLWDHSGHLLHTLKGHTAGILGVAFSPDNTMILTGSRDGTARLWDRKGRLLYIFMGYKDHVSSVAFSPDGESVLIGSFDNTAKLWNLKGKLLHTFQEYKEDARSRAFMFTSLGIPYNIPWSALKDENSISSVAFSPDGKMILTGNGDHTVKLWNRSGTLLHVFRGHEDSINSVAFSPNGKMILSGSDDDTAKLWSHSGNLLHTFEGHQGSVMSVAFSPNGEKIITGSFDHSVRLWDQSGQLLQNFRRNYRDDHSHVSSVSFSPDGKTILSGNLNKKTTLWSLEKPSLQTLQGHKSEIKNIIFSKDGEIILTSSLDSVKIWSLTGELLYEMQSNEDENIKVALSPDGETFLTGRYGSVELWDRQGKFLQKLQAKDGLIFNLEFSPDGKNVLLSSGENFQLLSNKTGKLLHIRHSFLNWDAAFSPDSQMILAGGFSHTAEMWNLSGKLLQTFQGHKASVNSVAFSPDGKTVLTGSKDRTAKMWNLSGKLLQTFQGHKGSVNSVEFSPDGKTVLTGSADGTAKLWNQSGRLQHTFYNVNSVVFSPDGNRILAGSSDNTAKFLNLDLNESLYLGCDFLSDFINGLNNPDLSKENRKLRKRAQRACKDVLPPKSLTEPSDR